MKHYTIINLLILAIGLVSASCNEPECNDIIMNDGSSIRVDMNKQFYSSEDEFIHDVSFSFPRHYVIEQVQSVDYTNLEEDVVYGHSQFFTGAWKIAEFGDWIEQYGLIPNTPYYVATRVYVKYVSTPPSGLRIIPKYGEEYMGFCPDIFPRTFQVYENAPGKIKVLTTGIRYIGYDSNRNQINISMPSFINNNANRLIWNFLIRDDGWD